MFEYQEIDGVPVLKQILSNVRLALVLMQIWQEFDAVLALKQIRPAFKVGSDTWASFDKVLGSLCYLDKFGPNVRLALALRQILTELDEACATSSNLIRI